jgi:hypothetical protein
MGTFVETAIDDYLLWLADQEKQTSVLSFCLRNQTKVAAFRQFSFPSAEFREHGDMETWRHRYGDI